MRFLTVLLGLMVFVSCGSQSTKYKSNRAPASVAKNPCVITKHSSKPWYRLRVNGKKVYPSWYTKEQVLLHKKKFCK